MTFLGFDSERTRSRTAAVAARSAVSGTPWKTVVVPVAVGTAVAVVLGVYGRVHTPTGLSLALPGFSGTLYVKAWLATLAFALALVQILTAMILEGRVKVDLPRASTVHRWSGRFAVLFTVPVAVHCLYALGLRFDDPRVLVHSLVGCICYGAFVAKMLLLVRPGLPRWAVPVAGGALFTALVALWLTSSLWVFTTIGIQL